MFKINLNVMDASWGSLPLSLHTSQICYLFSVLQCKLQDMSEFDSLSLLALPVTWTLKSCVRYCAAHQCVPSFSSPFDHGGVDTGDILGKTRDSLSIFWYCTASLRGEGAPGSCGGIKGIALYEDQCQTNCKGRELQCLALSVFAGEVF